MAETYCLALKCQEKWKERKIWIKRGRTEQDKKNAQGLLLAVKCHRPIKAIKGRFKRKF